MFTPEWTHLTLFQKMDKFMSIFPTLTKEEADYIAEIVEWDQETRAAFKLAKTSFENTEN